MIDAAVAGLTGFFDRPWFEVVRDVVDVLLVAFLIYRVLALLKGTRAMQTAIGLGLVFVVYQVAQRLGLLTLWTMLDTLLTYLVLLIVVIFQNDIRRALMRVGRGPLFRSARAEERESRVIDEVCRAAGALAQRRIGALIVFERDAVLDEFIEPGVILDAEPSRELLTSIFIPSFENPMHDGAVILREARIHQAGAFLPLTTSPRIDRALGTRHRAALGISEETDAVAVVVSEERGAITVCFSGNLVRDLDAASLETVLRGLLQPGTTRPRPAAAEPRATRPGAAEPRPTRAGAAEPRPTRPPTSEPRPTRPPRSPAHAEESPRPVAEPAAVSRDAAEEAGR